MPASYCCTAEVALEAWVDCEPHGYVLSQGRVPELMPVVTSHLARSMRAEAESSRSSLGLHWSSPQNSLKPPKCDPHIFMQLLRARDGQVHFLYFWKAFGEMARLAGLPQPEGLATELETLRDEVLRRLEEALRDAVEVPLPSVELPQDVLLQEVHRAAGMSACPRFWQAIAVSLDRQAASSALRLLELTHTLLDWLREVVIWESNAVALGSGVSPTSQVQGDEGLPVILHIYDVSQEESIQKLNHVLANEASPVKFGGVFHAGVEVNGLEWSFSYCNSATRPGISCNQPKMHPNHHYRETVVCGRTKMQHDEITRIISELLEDYPGNCYNLLRRNCCHFADDFARRLGLGGIPGWVHRLARIGASVETVLLAAQSVREAITGQPSEPLPWRMPPRAVRSQGHRGSGHHRSERNQRHAEGGGPGEALGVVRHTIQPVPLYQTVDASEFGIFGQPQCVRSV